MKAEIWDQATVAALRPTEVTAYLRATGWNQGKDATLGPYGSKAMTLRLSFRLVANCEISRFAWGTCCAHYR